MAEHQAPSKRSKLLPENAYRKLAPGEEYIPIVGPLDLRPEVTTWSVTMGLILTVIFAAACVYIALRAGSGIEASIPIAILAIFFGKLKQMRSSILENVMVQSIGQASGVVAAGGAFLVPAIYINQLTPSWWQIFLACFIGGVLGVVLIIPLRKYFVRDMHGDLPFPEATAVNEILCSGESSGPTAGKILIVSFLLGAVFDFMIEFFHFWPGRFSTTTLLGSWGESMSAGGFEVTVYGIAALFGLGYIIGIKYASIIAAGSVLSMLVIVPAIKLFGAPAEAIAYAGGVYTIADMDPAALFSVFVRPIGIGAIAISGVVGILRMSKIVGSSISLGFQGFKKGVQTSDAPRTQLDMSPKNVLSIQFGMVVLMALLFFVVAMTTVDSGTGQTYTVNASLLYAVVGAVVGFLLSFLFTPVAAQAIAIVGVNPVSGMTLITVVFTILVLVAFGLSGTGGMFVALIVGTAVCTALSTSGALISDFKIGYWIGATPRQQQRWKFLGIAVAALVVAFVIPVMDSSYQFLIEDPSNPGQMISNQEQLPAPQANMIAAVAKGLLDDPANQPWLLYGLGGTTAIVLFMAGIPMLAFALGMYLPIGINTAVLLGAVTAWIVGKTGGSERVRKSRSEQGILIASGMMAGAAILGIISATTRIPDIGAPIRHASVGVDIRLVTDDIKSAIQRDALDRELSDEFDAVYEQELRRFTVSDELREWARTLLAEGNLSDPLLASAAAESARFVEAQAVLARFSDRTPAPPEELLAGAAAAVEDERTTTRAARLFLAALHDPETGLPDVTGVEPYESFTAALHLEVEAQRLPPDFANLVRSEVSRKEGLEASLAQIRAGLEQRRETEWVVAAVADMFQRNEVSSEFLGAVKVEAERTERYPEVIGSIKVAAERGTLGEVLDQLVQEARAGVITGELLDAVQRRVFEDSLAEVAPGWSDSDVEDVLHQQAGLGRVPPEVVQAVREYEFFEAVKRAAGNRNLFRTLDTLRAQLALEAEPSAIRTAVSAMAAEGPVLTLDETPEEWFEGRRGNTLALVMLVLLGFACFLLARWGAGGTIREEDEGEDTTAPTVLG